MFMICMHQITHFILMKRLTETVAGMATMMVVFGVLSTARTSQIEPVYCHSHGQGDSSPSAIGRSGVRVRLQTAALYHLNPYSSQVEEDDKEVVNCTWIFIVTVGHSNAMIAVFELQRKGGGQVMAGDTIPNLVISVDENRMTYTFLPNMSLLQVKSGSVVTVSVSADHSRTSMDNALFIRMFLVTGDSCPSFSELFHKYEDSCITVRPANFICGTNQHLNNCSLMTNLTVQIKSADELNVFVRNVSSNKDFSLQFLSSPTIINGLLCKDGIITTCDRTAFSIGHGCGRRLIPGNLGGIARECMATPGLLYITLRVTRDGKPKLGLISSERAPHLSVLLAYTDDHATEAPVANVPSSHLTIGIAVAALLVTFAVTGISAAVIYKLHSKGRHGDTNANNAASSENGLGEQQTNVQLLIATDN